MHCGHENFQVISLYVKHEQRWMSKEDEGKKEGYKQLSYSLIHRFEIIQPYPDSSLSPWQEKRPLLCHPLKKKGQLLGKGKCLKPVYQPIIHPHART